MVVTIRRLSLEEAAKLSFDRSGHAKPKDSDDRWLDAAREVIGEREREHRGLIAYMTAWGKSGLIRPHTQEQIDKAILARALALVETEQHKGVHINAANRRPIAKQFRDRLIAVYEQERDRQLRLPETAHLATNFHKPEWLTDTTPISLPRPAEVGASQPSLPTIDRLSSPDAEARTYRRGLRPDHDPRLIPSGYVPFAQQEVKTPAPQSPADDDDGFAVLFEE